MAPSCCCLLSKHRQKLLTKVETAATDQISQLHPGSDQHERESRQVLLLLLLLLLVYCRFVISTRGQLLASIWAVGDDDMCLSTSNIEIL